jgi:glycosyltransferase involved in cell wall biosynthesis
MKPRRMVAVTHSDFDPASRFRVMQLIPHWEARGWRVRHRPVWPSLYWRSRAPKRLRRLHARLIAVLRRFNMIRTVRLARNADVVLINRELMWGAESILRVNPRVIFDFDDAIYLTDSAAHVEWLCRRAALVVVGNAFLAAQVRQWAKQTRVIPTLVDIPPAVPASASQGAARVGWLGSGYSIAETLFPFIPMFAQWQRELDFEFVIVSKPAPALPAASPGDATLRWRFVPWRPGIERDIAGLMDIGVMPLVDTPYQRGKCGAKLLQYMAAGLPAIASPVGVNQTIVRDGETGFLADTAEDWRKALRLLIADPELRRRLGQAGRAACERDYSIEAGMPRWMEALDASAARPLST